MPTDSAQSPDSGANQPDAGGSPDQGGGAGGAQGGGSPSSQQANGFQELMATWMKTATQIKSQNEFASEEMDQIIAACRKAFLKSIQANNPPQQQQPAPPGQ